MSDAPRWNTACSLEIAMMRSTGRSWLSAAARAGYAGKGVIYVLLGSLATMAAFGEGRIKDKEETVRVIHDRPGGDILLVITGIALCGYTLWRLVQLVFDPEHKGHGPKGLAERIGHAASGIVHGALAVLAFEFAAGDRSGHDHRGTLGWLLGSQPGRIAVAVAGLAVIGAAFAQLHKAVTARFVRELRTGEMSAAEERWSVAAGRIGIAAYSVVLAMIGYGLFKAGIAANPRLAKGIGDALRELAGRPNGQLLLASAAIGLVLYGLFQFVVARYRRIPAPA